MVAPPQHIVSHCSLGFINFVFSCCRQHRVQRLVSYSSTVAPTDVVTNPPASQQSANNDYYRRKVRRKRPSSTTTPPPSFVDNALDEAVPDFLPLSAGNGKEQPEEKDEKEKTLSDQVKEGKYGLIQNELFQDRPKRPGILSYDTNPETANDNRDNLGGLNQDDIWLAENSLLVLKGGDLNSPANDEPWQPIDGYKAGKRPVKIPPNPKVPPPFPVQLDEDGPVEFLGKNPFPIFNPFTNESINLFSPDGLPKAEPFFHPFQPGNITFIPPPLLHSLVNTNQSFINPFLNNFLPPPPLFDPNNTTEIDEDDPSLYYPPPYSFEYDSNYTNPVPPGPLVPGIVLPPPPNYFSRLNDTKKPLSQDVITRLQKIGRTKLYTTTSTKPTKPTSRTLLKITPTVEITKAKVRPLVTTTTLKPTTVYYNYYEAKEPTPTPRKRVTRPTTMQPPSSTTVRPTLPHTYLPAKQFNYDKYLYITPKPEVVNNGRPDDYNIQLLPSRQSQIKSFEHEIETIKQTLRYYKTTTPVPRQTTSKAVYEYSFDNSGNNDYFRPIIPPNYSSERPTYYKKGRGYYDSSPDSTTEYPAAPYYVPKYYEPEQTTQSPTYISIQKQILRELIPQTGGAIPQAVPQPFRPRYVEQRKPLERVQIGNQTYIVYRIRTPSRPTPFRERLRYPQQQQQMQVPLDSDININYKYPPPQLNPDSEFVPAYNTRYKASPSLIQYKLPGDQAHVFFLPPIKKR